MRHGFIKKNWKTLLGIIIISGILALFTERLWYNQSLIISTIKGTITFNEGIKNLYFCKDLFTGKAAKIFSLFLLVYVFLGLHFVIPPKKIYAYLFKKRYFVALIAFLFLVLNQYHCSSIANFDNDIQPGYTSEYSQPVLGWARAIRSDEWLVGTPGTLSQQFEENPFSEYTYLPRATETYNSLNLSYASLSNPFNLAYFIFGVETGFSIAWFSQLILTFLVSIEFLLILCKKNKLISVAGAVLITFSGYNLWWSQVSWILAAEACIVCGWQFLNQTIFWKKLLLAIGLGFALAYFVCLLYPAWQVPVGYLFLGLLVWCILSNINQIKNMKAIDWALFIAAFVFAGTIILAYLMSKQEYNSAMTQTVYPGTRFSTGGIDQITLQKLFAGILTPMSIINKVSNASEYSSMLTFFPVPLCLSIVYLIRKKEWKKNLLLIVLVLYTLFIGSYLIIGWPTWLCKYSLMSYSPGSRCVDVFSYAQLLILLYLLSTWNKEDKLKPVWATIIVVLYIIFEFIVCKHLYVAENIPTIYYLVASVILGLLLYFLIVNRTKKNGKGSYFEKTVYIISAGVLLTGLMIHPLQKGFDVIYEKPLAKEIANITEQDSNGKWLDVTGGIVSQQYLLACGAPTINSTNIIPNMDLWKKLDPDNQYSDIYNRYEHVSVVLTDDATSFELIQEDWIKLNLNYEDLSKTEASYIYYNSDEGDVVEELNQRYTLIYQDQCSIYKVN